MQLSAGMYLQSHPQISYEKKTCLVNQVEFLGLACTLWLATFNTFCVTATQKMFRYLSWEAKLYCCKESAMYRWSRNLIDSYQILGTGSRNSTCSPDCFLVWGTWGLGTRLWYLHMYEDMYGDSATRMFIWYTFQLYMSISFTLVDTLSCLLCILVMLPSLLSSSCSPSSPPPA